MCKVAQIYIYIKKNSSETSECALTHFERVGSVLLANVDVSVDLCLDTTFPHAVCRSEGISACPTHQAGWSTRWPGCRTSCWAAAPTRRSKPPQWTCSWCLGEDWPPSPSSPSGQPAEGRSRRSTRMAHTALPHTAGTPRCRSGRTCHPCQTEHPTPRSV